MVIGYRSAINLKWLGRDVGDNLGIMCPHIPVRGGVFEDLRGFECGGRREACRNLLLASGGRNRIMGSFSRVAAARAKAVRAKGAHKRGLGLGVCHVDRRVRLIRYDIMKAKSAAEIREESMS